MPMHKDHKGPMKKGPDMMGKKKHPMPEHHEAAHPLAKKAAPKRGKK